MYSPNPPPPPHPTPGTFHFGALESTRMSPTLGQILVGKSPGPRDKFWMEFPLLLGQNLNKYNLKQKSNQ